MGKNNFFTGNILRWSKYHGYKLQRLHDTPHSIAIGAAIGVFWGVFPTFMLGFLLSIGTASLLKVNKTSAVIGSFIMNPITTPFFWTISAYVGGLITKTDWHLILKMVKDLNFSLIMKSTVWIYLLGNTIVSLFFSYFTYLIVLFIVKNYQDRKTKRMKNK